MTVSDATGNSDTDPTDADVIFTPGEEVIFTMLEEIQAQLDELTEKVNNLNLNYNEGYSVD